MSYTNPDTLPVIVPYHQLSEEALRGVLEEFSTRDGTDETDATDKIASLRAKLKAGLLTLLFEPDEGRCHIVWTRDLPCP